MKRNSRLNSQSLGLPQKRLTKYTYLDKNG